MERRAELKVAGIPFHLYYPRLDTVGQMMRAKGKYEPITTEAFVETVEGCWNVVIGGAHVGYYAILAEKLGCNVYAYEPHPVLFKFLAMNCDTNGCKNITIERTALSDEIGERDFWVADKNMADGRLTEMGHSLKIRVTSTRLDSIMVRDLDFILLDCQGHEFRILSGTIRRPKMIIEYFPINGDAAKLRQELKENYDTLISLDDKRKVAQTITTEELEQIYPDGSGMHTNLLCL